MSLEELSGSSNRSLLLVHGRDFKPAEEAFTDLSMAALRSGMERDCPDLLESFDAIHKSVAWYGDLNAEILHARGKNYDENLDIGDRRNALATLREISARKRFGIRQYDSLPGKSAVPEAIVDVIAPVLGAIGFCVPLIRSVSRDFARYFDRKSAYAMRVRERLRTQLCALMDRDDKIVLISHGTGSVVAYDVLWQLSHDPDLKEQYGDKKVELWLTLGSPLGDSNIRKRLLGAKEKPMTKFPLNVISWHNVAAEDDYTCHDNTLADDFKLMLQQRVVSVVHDYRIFNLAVRYGRSNPHSSIGYYIHPRVSKILADWLKVSDAQTTPKYTF
jgi:hypothetical protein